MAENYREGAKMKILEAPQIFKFKCNNNSNSQLFLKIIILSSVFRVTNHNKN